MASATPRDLTASSTAINIAATTTLNRNSVARGKSLSEAEAADVVRAFMSPRQIELDRRWRQYNMRQYDLCKADWNGRQDVNDAGEVEAVMRRGYLDGGYVDSGQSLPVKFRKPTAPGGLVTRVVNRFAGLLFSERRLPQWDANGDNDTADYAAAVAKAGKLWLTMRVAKRFGGAMGTAIVGLRTYNGQIQYEAHDPRWVSPEWSDRGRLQLKSVEIRYLYDQIDWDPDARAWVTTWLWYRRIINETEDTEFEPAFFDPRDDNEPDWVVKSTAQHDLGFCPVVWIQNLPNPSEPDGLPDYMPRAVDLANAPDQIAAQTHKAALAALDPTHWAATDAEEQEVRLGLGHMLTLPAGSQMGTLEISAEVIKAGMDLNDKETDNFLELCDVVLEETEKVQTAFEVERRRERMYAKADEQRGQYGNGAIDLIVMAFKVAQKFGANRPDMGKALTLPPKVVTNDDGSIKREPRKLGPAPWFIDLDWPRYTEVALADIQQAVDSAAKAKLAKLVAGETATSSVAEYFRVKNIQAELEKLRKADEADKAEFESQATQPVQKNGKPAAAAPGGGAMKLGGLTERL